MSIRERLTLLAAALVCGGWWGYFCFVFSKENVASRNSYPIELICFCSILGILASFPFWFPALRPCRSKGCSGILIILIAPHLYVFGSIMLNQLRRSLWGNDASISNLLEISALVITCIISIYILSKPWIEKKHHTSQ